MDFSFLVSDVNVDLYVKLLLSVILGFLVGLDRQLTNKSAGLRTQVLVCLGSMIFTYLSIHSFNWGFSPTDLMNNQPSRVAAQILTGIGFIGGGVILKTQGNVYGITTAASLWMVSSIGMAIGADEYYLAIMGTLLALVILVCIRTLERKVLNKYSSKRMKACILVQTKFENIVKIKDFLSANYKKLTETRLETVEGSSDRVTAEFTVMLSSEETLDSLYNKLQDLKIIDKARIAQVLSIYE